MRPGFQATMAETERMRSPGADDWGHPRDDGPEQHNAHSDRGVVQGRARDWVDGGQHKDHLQANRLHTPEFSLQPQNGLASVQHELRPNHKPVLVQQIVTLDHTLIRQGSGILADTSVCN